MLLVFIREPFIPLYTRAGNPVSLSGFTTSPIIAAPTDSTASLPSFSGDVPNANKTDNLNFLRGAWQTNDQGIVTFNTIYPGFCMYTSCLLSKGVC